MADADKRMREFVWYHINGDGDCNGQVLRAIALRKGLSVQDCFDLAYFYSTTYCCASAVFLLENRNRIKRDAVAFAEEYKNKLIFQSDRKYVRMRDTFGRMLIEWAKMLSKASGEFNDKFINRNMVSTGEAIVEVERWYFFKRFSAYLFLETYCDILGLTGAHMSGMTYEGDSMTFAGGLFYVFGMDAEAEYVQRHHRLPTDNAFFEELIRELQAEVRSAGGDDNFVKLETSLCAYEKFFKGTRYNGYYADRQLGELVEMGEREEFVTACDDVYKARQDAIDHQYLGEANGWDGIRKELKTHYRDTHAIVGYAG